MALCFIIEDEAAFGRMMVNLAGMHEMRFVSAEKTAASILEAYGVSFIAGALGPAGERAVRGLFLLPPPATSHPAALAG